MKKSIGFILFSLLLFSCGITDSGSSNKESTNLTPRLSQQANGVTVHFQKPAGWSGAYIHYWGAVSSDWNNCPAMTDEGDGWYTFTIEGTSSTNLLFKAHSGHTGTKTTDQNGITGGYYVLNENK